MQTSINKADNREKIQETIRFYNSTKCVVLIDVLDQYSRVCTTRSAARRWAVAIFYNVLGIEEGNPGFANILKKKNAIFFYILRYWRGFTAVKAHFAHFSVNRQRFSN